MKIITTTAWRTYLAAVVLSSCSSLPVLAEMLRIEFHPEATRTSGPMHDGTLLGRGQVYWDSPHTGFRLWLEDGRGITGDRRLSLTPPPNMTGAPLHVRLEAEGGGESGEPAERGLRIMKSDNSVYFSVVADGDQKVSPGFWRMRIGAAAVLSP